METVLEMESDVLVFGTIAIIAVMFLIMLIVTVVLAFKLRKLNKRYAKLVNGDDGLNIEELISAMQKKINQLQFDNELAKNQLAAIGEHIKKLKGKVEIHRFNGFSQQFGNDMSFSIAILDEELDGIVLTGIHGREQTYMFAKPVKQGGSEYPLSDEEKLVIDRAAAKKFELPMKA